MHHGTTWKFKAFLEQLLTPIINPPVQHVTRLLIKSFHWSDMQLHEAALHVPVSGCEPFLLAGNFLFPECFPLYFSPCPWDTSNKRQCPFRALFVTEPTRNSLFPLSLVWKLTYSSETCNKKAERILNLFQKGGVWNGGRREWRVRRRDRDRTWF